MKFILVAILTTLMGCAATVSRDDYYKLRRAYNSMGDNYHWVLNELDKWRPSRVELQEKAEATEELEKTLEDFVVKFATKISDVVGKNAEIKADEIAFADDYEFAIVRMWLKFTDVLGKYYLMFVRDKNDEWECIGYYQSDLIEIRGNK